MGLMVGKQITMNENGTFSSTYPGLGSSGTFTLSGNTISGQSGLGSFTIVANIADNVMRWTGTAVDGSTFEYSLTRVSNDSEE